MRRDWLLNAVLGLVVFVCLVVASDARAWGTVGQVSEYSAHLYGKTGKGPSRSVAAANALPADSAWSNISANCRRRLAYSVGTDRGSSFDLVTTEYLENYVGNGYACGGPIVTTSAGAITSASTPELACRAGSAPNGQGSCTCVVGKRPDANGDCAAYSCSAGSGSREFSHGPYPSWEKALLDKQYCQAGLPSEPASTQVGCRRVFRTTAAKGYTGYYWALGVESFSGDYCDSAPPAAPGPNGAPEIQPDKAPGENPPPVPCGKGTCPGTVNGTAVCVPCAETVREKVTDSQAATGADSSASSAQPVTSATAPEGTKFEAVDRTCGLNGMCSTTVTYYDDAGKVIGTSTTKTGTEEAAQSSACKDNPELAMCKQGSFGGSCSGGFTCAGDPVQCALAKEVHLRNCQLYDTPSALSQAGEAAMSGQAQPEGHPGASASGVSLLFADAIDRTNSLSGGCPASLHFVTAGRAWSLDFAPICSSMVIAGQLVVAVSLLAAVFIVFRG